MKVTIRYKCIYDRNKVDLQYPHILVTMQCQKVKRAYEFAFGYGMKNSKVEIRLEKQMFSAVYTIGFNTDYVNTHKHIEILKNALQCLQNEFNGDLDMYVLHCIKKLFARQFVSDVDLEYPKTNETQEYKGLVDQILHRKSKFTVDLEYLREEPK